MTSFLKNSALVLQSTAGVFAVLGLIVAALYGQCLHFDFVSFDDDYHVYNNRSVQEFSPASVLEILTGRTRVSGDLEAQAYANRIYIPVTFFSFQLQHALTGLNPAWFHAANLFIFFLISLSVYHILLFWLKNKPAAWICALLFAVHPLNTEPAAWITGRKDLLCGLFFILGLLYYGHYTAGGKKKDLLTALACGLLAALAKPSGGIFIAVLLLYDFCFRRPLVWKKIFLEKSLLLLALLAPVMHSLTHYALSGNPPLSAGRLFFAAGIPLFALGHAFTPLSLSAFYPYPQPLEWSWAQITVMGTGAAGLLILWRFARNSLRPAVFAAGLLCLTLLPYVLRNVIFPDGGFTSDRYMLLPFLGLLLLAGIVLKNILAQSLKWGGVARTSAFLAGLCWIGALAWTAHSRAAVWQNSETLALDIVKKYPDAANAQEELGRIYQARGVRQKAAIHFKAAYLADPKPRRLIQLYELYGLNRPLMELYQSELRKNPQSSTLNAGLGMVYFRLKQFSQAEHFLGEAVRGNPENVPLYNVLAGTLYYQNKIPEAVAVWQTALSLNPADTDAANNLGAAYLALGKRKEAEQLFRQVLERAPQHSSARRNLEKLGKNP